ncbi:MAG: methyltransferase domain-containing protein [Pseudomonadota bacterium]
MFLNPPAPPPSPPSDWIVRWAPLLPPGSSVLDLACGSGRHFRWLQAHGFAVTGVDRDGAALAGLAAFGETVLADLENAPWPLAGRQFTAVVVTHYLFRPLLPTMVASVAPGGLLLYETFAAGQETVGRPSRPDFLLQPGELLRACAGLHVLAYEDGWLPAPLRRVQRIAARRLPATEAPHDLYPAPGALFHPAG